MNTTKHTEAADAIPEGFTPWTGGECPEDARGRKTRVALRNGNVSTRAITRGEGWHWGHCGGSGDIIAYCAEQPEAKADEIYAAYMTWPEDIRAKLSLHDLRRMSGWAPHPNPAGWAIDTSAGRPILTLNNCSVIEAEDARYLLRLVQADQQPKPAEGGAVATVGVTWAGEECNTVTWMPGHALLPAGTKFYTHAQPVPVESLGRDAEGVEALAKQMFDAQKDRLAVDWERQWQPTKDFWIAKANEYLARRLTASDARPAVDEAMKQRAGHAYRKAWVEYVVANGATSGEFDEESEAACDHALEAALTAALNPEQDNAR